ncbi:MAG: transposase [Anaerolineae bacterium]
MSNQKRGRKKWSPAKKLQIVLEALQSDGKLSEICRREGLSPTQVYQWRKQLLASADAVFSPKRKNGSDPKIEKLEGQNQRMKNVIAEITAENLDLKKTLSD